MNVNDAIARWPALLPVFNRYGIDSCCCGALPIGEVAREHPIDLHDLVRALTVHTECSEAFPTPFTQLAADRSNAIPHGPKIQHKPGGLTDTRDHDGPGPHAGFHLCAHDFAHDSPG